MCKMEILNREDSIMGERSSYDYNISILAASRIYVVTLLVPLSAQRTEATEENNN